MNKVQLPDPAGHSPILFTAVYLTGPHYENNRLQTIDGDGVALGPVYILLSFVLKWRQ